MSHQLVFMTGTSYSVLWVHEKAQLSGISHNTGFGCKLALAALQRGDKIIATTLRLSANLQSRTSRWLGHPLLSWMLCHCWMCWKALQRKPMGFMGGLTSLWTVLGTELAHSWCRFDETIKLFKYCPSTISHNYTRLTISMNVFGVLNVAHVFFPYQHEAKTGVYLIISIIINREYYTLHHSWI